MIARTFGVASAVWRNLWTTRYIQVCCYSNTIREVGRWHALWQRDNLAHWKWWVVLLCISNSTCLLDPHPQRLDCHGQERSRNVRVQQVFVPLPEYVERRGWHLVGSHCWGPAQKVGLSWSACRHQTDHTRSVLHDRMVYFVPDIW